MKCFSDCPTAALVALLLTGLVGAGLAQGPAPLIRYGGMHEALAKGEHQARVRVAELLEQEHLFAVGALEGLAGEITILDSVVYATTLTDEDQPLALDGAQAAATMLVGQAVPHWTRLPIADGVAPDRFDDTVRDAANGQGLDVSTPFLFVIEGMLTDVRLHVIHGACPVHARMNKLELAAERRPYELEIETLRGTVVGVYATDAVGKLTHPATSTHAHLIYVDEKTGEQITGHLERVGVAPGASLSVPSISAESSDERSRPR